MIICGEGMDSVVDIRRPTVITFVRFGDYMNECIYYFTYHQVLKHQREDLTTVQNGYCHEVYFNSTTTGIYWMS